MFLETFRINVRVLKEKDRILYDKLVRLAGGDSGIVIKVLSNPHRSSVDLKTAIREIEELRNTRKHAPASLVPQAGIATL